MSDELPSREEILARRRKPRAPAPAPDAGSPRPTVGPLHVAVFLLLAAGAVFLAFKLLEVSKIQDCVMQGRKNCDHIDDPNER